MSKVHGRRVQYILTIPVFHQSEHYFLGYPSSLLSTTNHNIHPWKLCLAWDLSWRKPHHPLWVWKCARSRKCSDPETMWCLGNMGGRCDQQLPNLCDLQHAEYYKSKFVKYLNLQHQRGAMMFLDSMSFLCHHFTWICTLCNYNCRWYSFAHVLCKLDIDLMSTSAQNTESTNTVLIISTIYKQMALTQRNLDRVMNDLRMVVLDANRTEDQSTENLAAVLNLFQRVVNETVVLDNQVSPCLSLVKFSCSR